MFGSASKLNAYRVFLIYSGVTSLAFGLVFTLNMFYYVEHVKLNPLQLVLTGTALELSIFLFEIPTGIVADVYSRRLSIIVGMFIIGLGLAVSAIPIFPIILLSQAIWGFGYTFTSGAVEAWITDEIGEAPAAKAFLRASQVAQICGIFGVVFSVALGYFWVGLPLVIGGLVFGFLGAFLLRFMPETGFNPTPREDRSSWGQMVGTLRDGGKMLRRRPILINILLISIGFGAFSEAYDRLSTAHLVDNVGLPPLGALGQVGWFGLISLVSILLGVTLIEVVRRRLPTEHQPTLIRALTILNAFILLGVIGFALAGSLWQALPLLWFVGLLRGLQHPLYVAWINQGLDSRVRATVLSMSGQADALGEIGGGPVLGLFANQYGIRSALVGTSLILMPVLLVYRAAFRSSERDSLALEAPQAAGD